MDSWNNFWSNRFNRNVEITFHLYQRIEQRLITINMIINAIENGIYVEDIDKDGEPRLKFLLEGVVVILHKKPGNIWRVLTAFYDV